MWPPLRSASVRVGDLHRERDPLARHPGEDARLEHGAEVVGVRDERVAVAAFEQGVEQPRGEQGRVEVAVTGRAPLERRVVRPLDRHQVVDADLRLLVLHEVGGHVGREGVVLRERLERLVVRVEGVHQHEREPRAGPAPRLEHLAGDDVEEGEPVLGLDQRLGLGHAHARAEPAVELDHDRLGRAARRRPAGRRAPGRPRPARSRTPAACRSRPLRAGGSSGRRCRSPARGALPGASSRRWPGARPPR